MVPASGEHGEVRVGGRLAARAARWTLTPVGDGDGHIVLEGVTARDDYWLDQEAATMVWVRLGGQWLAWAATRQVEMTYRVSGPPRIRAAE